MADSWGQFYSQVADQRQRELDAAVRARNAQLIMQGLQAAGQLAGNLKAASDQKKLDGIADSIAAPMAAKMNTDNPVRPQTVYADEQLGTPTSPVTANGGMKGLQMLFAARNANQADAARQLQSDRLTFDLGQRKAADQAANAIGSSLLNTETPVRPTTVDPAEQLIPPTEAQTFEGGAQGLGLLDRSRTTESMIDAREAAAARPHFAPGLTGQIQSLDYSSGQAQDAAQALIDGGAPETADTAQKLDAYASLVDGNDKLKDLIANRYAPHPATAAKAPSGWEETSTVTIGGKPVTKTTRRVPIPADAPAASASEPRRISTDAEYAALASGQQYIDPQGNVRVKP